VSKVVDHVSQQVQPATGLQTLYHKYHVTHMRLINVCIIIIITIINNYYYYYYLSQEVYAFIEVCLLAGLQKNYSTEFHKIWWKGSTWAMKETRFLW